MIEIEASGQSELRPRIGVIGVGGAGGNAVANMIAASLDGVEFIVANTDAQALVASPASHLIQLGRKATQGLGAGSSPALGKAAAEESLDEINRAVQGTQMCFIAAGMGGGTGTGAAPVIARAARDQGVLTVGVVSKPFAFEGARRARAAEAGIEELRRHVDTLIVIPNQNLFRIADQSTTFKQAFALADDVLQQGVRGITDLMVMPGLVNLDFADIRSVMGDMGRAMMGTGEASGENRAFEASERAISNPLLDGAITGARGLIISIVGGEDLRLMEIDEAAGHIKDLADPEADIIWGSAIDPQLEGRMRVSVIATGLDAAAAAVEAPMRMPVTPSAAAPQPFLLAASPPLPLFPTLPVEAIAPPPVLEPEPWTPTEASAVADLFGPSVEAPLPGLFRPADANAAEELLLDTHNRLSIILSEAPETREAGSLPDLSDPESRAPRGPSLFQRVAAMARGARIGLDDEPTVVMVAQRTEGPGVYTRRPA